MLDCGCECGVLALDFTDMVVRAPSPSLPPRSTLPISRLFLSHSPRVSGCLPFPQTPLAPSLLGGSCVVSGGLVV